jgi:hypothetical protein
MEAPEQLLTGLRNRENPPAMMAGSVTSVANQLAEDFVPTIQIILLPKPHLPNRMVQVAHSEE